MVIGSSTTVRVPFWAGMLFVDITRTGEEDAVIERVGAFITSSREIIQTTLVSSKIIKVCPDFHDSTQNCVTVNFEDEGLVFSQEPSCNDDGSTTPNQEKDTDQNADSSPAPRPNGKKKWVLDPLAVA